MKPAIPDPDAPLPIIEPFRIRTVEPLRMTTREERERLLAEVGFNLFGLHADDVLIDLLTDSGTGAMSIEQWAAMMRADESYAGARSFFRFRDAVREVTGLPEVIPTHQGRAAEHLLCSVLVKPGQVVLGNTHFDTTRAHIELAGADAVDLPHPSSEDAASDAPFKGDVDLPALERALEEEGDRVAFVLVTATNNALGGHPVRPSNVAAAAALARKHGRPIFLDAARFGENAALVIRRDPAYANKTPAEVAREIFDCVDGVMMSAKKDAMVNIGGFIALRDPDLAAKLREREIITEGFPTYGGLAGRDLDAIAVGLHEVLHPDYLEYRLASVRYLAEGLLAAGWPVVRPAGGHAVFIDARAALPHIPPEQFPGQALACALYREGGIRSVEVGTLMFGEAAHGDLVRLAIPRRVYTQSHIDYVVAIGARLARRKAELRGLRIVHEPAALRHFTARLEEL